jgi:hypothetical protein
MFRFPPPSSPAVPEPDPQHDSICLASAYSKWPSSNPEYRSAIAPPLARLKMGASFRLTIPSPSEGPLFFFPGGHLGRRGASLRGPQSTGKIGGWFGPAGAAKVRPWLSQVLSLSQQTARA